MESSFTNRLIHETSPYLLQHGHNPVDWYPWGAEALERAQKENKPILVSIGYSACHWCHVMERESFENEQVAAFMNEHFVNIKIDREERPDLDHIYMDAVQSISGSGGWPLNVFCTPDTKPFFGGTYFPPVAAYRRIGWLELLQNIQQAWVKDPRALIHQSEQLLQHIQKLSERTSKESVLNEDTVHEMEKLVMATADLARGGFGAAPKFPQTMTIRFLLAYGKIYQQEKAQAHALHSLRSMLYGGIYDQLGGGLCRYSTDDHWLAPHFEKMLYDNALFLSAICDAYTLTKQEEWKEAIQDVWRFLRNEMKSADGGFYSAMDADSEGEEGKYYVWQKQEVEELLGDAANQYCSYYGITENGNWEGKNILNTTAFLTNDALHTLASKGSKNDLIKSCDAILLEHRSKRVAPQKDDKIILGWNSLLLTAACRSYAATGEEEYKLEALQLFAFIDQVFLQPHQHGHVYKAGVLKYPAFLDDMAYFIEACLHLQEITGEHHFLHKAYHLAQGVCADFLLPNGLFSYTQLSQQDVLFNRPEMYDGALPSGNSVMARNLLQLSLIFEDGHMRALAERLIQHAGESMAKFPGSFSNWAQLFLCNILNNNEIVIFGDQLDDMRKELLQEFLPGTLSLSLGTENQSIPMLKHKKNTSGNGILYCKGNVCQPPVESVKILLTSIK